MMKLVVNTHGKRDTNGIFKDCGARFLLGKGPKGIMATNIVSLLYITCKSSTEAKKIASFLLSKKLIACANVFPIASMYKWKGKLQNSKETVLIAKTKAGNYEKVKKTVSKMHSYETPCIMKLSAEANTPYYQWLMNEIK